MHDTFHLLQVSDFPALRRKKLETLQANLGYRCNQSCVHCHVAASPQRTEEMSWETSILIVKWHRILATPMTTTERHTNAALYPHRLRRRFPGDPFGI